MFKLFRRKSTIPSDRKLQEIRDILFPPYVKRVDGSGTVYNLDFSVDMNLEAVVSDIEDGYNDRASLNTLRNINDKLIRVRELLDVYQMLDTEAQYVLIDDSHRHDVGETIESSNTVDLL